MNEAKNMIRMGAELSNLSLRVSVLYRRFSSLAHEEGGPALLYYEQLKELEAWVKDARRAKKIIEREDQQIIKIDVAPGWELGPLLCNCFQFFWIERGSLKDMSLNRILPHGGALLAPLEMRYLRAGRQGATFYIRSYMS